jgi:hypothetical protein
VHICFGYAAIIHVRPSGYSFLPELAGSSVRQISVETAQSNLDCSVLEKLPGKTIILGVLDLSDVTVDAPEAVAQRIQLLVGGRLRDTGIGARSAGAGELRHGDVGALDQRRCPGIREIRSEFPTG